MPDSPIPGHITKEAAAKHVKRSYRALGRDLTAAMKVADADVLQHWKLSTKDGTVRNGLDVTVEMVTQLRDDGFNPTWYGSAAWLEDRYGLRAKETAQDESAEVVASKMRRTPTDAAKPGNKRDSGGGERATPLPDDVTFLKQMIRDMQREKREEMARSGEREKKLFEQLAVKDRQISAWDEVTQGLTRGLATGAIQPTLVSGRSPKDEHQQKPESSSASTDRQVAEVIDATPAPRKKPAAKKGNTRKPRQKKTQKKRQPKWYEMPTLKNVLSHRKP